jgi:predicted metal-dependent phosphoesterase TrpH
MSRIDLHAHTEHSDGTHAPAALVRLARDVGLALLAVTDHDTTSGLPEAQAEGRALGVEVVVGCEISTRIAQGNVHVLAYDFDPEDAAFQGFLAGVRAARDRRNERILQRLVELGVPLTAEEVHAQVRGRILTRPHFARALVARGHVPDLRTAFGQYLRDGGPAYVQAEGPAPEAAVRAVRAAGGIAVLAHPGQVRLPDRAALTSFLATLRSAGLAGLEVQHPSQDPEQRAFLADLARQHDLVPSGGSDFHGETKPHVRLGVGDGTIDVRRETWDALRARRAPAWS